MPNKKAISQYLGIGRGSFRKAFISVLLNSYSDDDAFEIGKLELGDNCIYCGLSDKKQLLQPDYLWIQSEGGLFKRGNVVPACPMCNSKRGNKKWIDFINEEKIISEKEKNSKITKIHKFMKKYGMDKKPDINEYINNQQTEIFDHLNMLLDALTQGLRSKIESPQKKNIKFNNPNDMFDELVSVAERYLIKLNSNSCS